MSGSGRRDPAESSVVDERASFEAVEVDHERRQ
jgi:hypothetical protein